jgi:hypothetical protein
MKSYSTAERKKDGKTKNEQLGSAICDVIQLLLAFNSKLPPSRRSSGPDAIK